MLATSPMDILDNKSLTLFLSIVIPIILVILVIIIYYLYRKEKKNYKEELVSYLDGVQTKKEIFSAITKYILKSPNVPFSLIKVELDKYEELLENLGKDETSSIVKKIAFKIIDYLPKRVEFSRIAVDQFLIFARGEYETHQVVDFAKKIPTMISEPIKIFEETSINVTASVALAYYPNHGSNIKQLMESLDIAIYTCKREGGNQFRVYTPESATEESANLEYYKEIKQGIKNKEFTLYYQPQVDCVNKKIYGFEGLLRWNHPKHGVLSPFKFITILEQSGDIKWVGEWGLESLIRTSLEVQKAFPGENQIFSLNLSPKQLLSPSLPIEFQKIVRKYKVNPSTIALEIEEFAIYDKHDVLKKNIKDLKSIGFKISVDGFGLDFNGIKKLEELQVDIVKLDKEYMDPDTDMDLKQRFISLLIDYTAKSNITIIAEGIEDKNNLKYARDLGIDIIQGYNFSQPMVSEDVIKYVRNQEFLSKI